MTSLRHRSTLSILVVALALASCGGGSSSEPSGKLGAPATPSALTAASVQANSVDLLWLDNASNETGFEVQRADDQNGAAGNYAVLATLGADVTLFSDAGLAPSTGYWYRVRALGDSQNSPACAALFVLTAADPLAPNAPQALSAAANGGSSVQLVWTDASSSEDGFDVELASDASGEPGAFQAAGQAGPDATNYTVVGLAPKTKYWFRVRAFDGSHVSSNSNLASATTTSNTSGGGWSKTYVDAAGTGFSVALPTSTGFLGAGFIGQLPGIDELQPWVTRLDDDGDIVWQKGLATHVESWALDMLPRANQGAALLVLRDNLAPAIVELDSAGSIVEQLALVANEDLTSLALLPGPSGGLYYCAFSASSKFVLASIDASGSLAWSKSYSAGSASIAMSATSSSDGSILVGGGVFVTGSVEGAWVAKIDTAGAVIWSNQYLLPNGDIAGFNSLAAASDGGLFASGYTTDQYSSFATWIARVGADGALTWQEEVLQPATLWATTRLAPASGNRFRMTVVPYSQVTVGELLEINASGGMNWGRAYSGLPVAWPVRVAELSNGDSLVSGSAVPQDPHDAGAWLMRTDFDGDCGSLATPLSFASSATQALTIATTVTSAPYLLTTYDPQIQTVTTHAQTQVQVP